MVHKDAATKRPRKPRRKAEPVIVVKVSTAAWTMALEIAEGNVKRLKTQPDGSVMVVNHG